jgi:hypothetical protein
MSRVFYITLMYSDGWAGGPAGSGGMIRFRKTAIDEPWAEG